MPGVGGAPQATVRIDLVRTKGVFALDGQSFDVENAFHRMERGEVLRSVVIL